jgi:uncharacterized membrane protein
VIDGYPRALVMVAAVGAGLVAGVLFAFSTFVMQALGRLPDADGLSAMQAINESVPRSPWFMGAFFGTAVLCVGLAVIALTRLDMPIARYQLIGSGLYLAGIVLTVVYHVPSNDVLAKVNPASAGASDIWRTYLTNWTAWNHIRTLTSFAAAVTFMLALRVD